MSSGVSLPCTSWPPGRKITGSLPSASAKTAAGEIVRAEADHDQRRAAALPFDQRIGGKRGRERNEADCGGGGTRSSSSTASTAPANANRQVMPRRQRFRLGDDAFALAEQHGVRIGAAGIDAEKQEGSATRKSPEIRFLAINTA